jgi:hypothetical protein
MPPEVEMRGGFVFVIVAVAGAYALGAGNHRPEPASRYSGGSAPSAPMPAAKVPQKAAPAQRTVEGIKPVKPPLQLVPQTASIEPGAVAQAQPRQAKKPTSDTKAALSAAAIAALVVSTILNAFY